MFTMVVVFLDDNVRYYHQLQTWRINKVDRLLMLYPTENNDHYYGDIRVMIPLENIQYFQPSPQRTTEDE